MLLSSKEQTAKTTPIGDLCTSRRLEARRDDLFGPIARRSHGSLGRAGKRKGTDFDEFGSLVVVMFATSVQVLGLAVTIRDHEAAVRH